MLSGTKGERSQELEARRLKDKELSHELNPGAPGFRLCSIRGFFGCLNFV
jgi:hypothetical protein